jgi:hypothetical protein
MFSQIEQLMAVRHEAYQVALAASFTDAALTAKWRQANRDYVLAQSSNPAPVLSGPSDTLIRRKYRTQAERDQARKNLTAARQSRLRKRTAGLQAA